MSSDNQLVKKVVRPSFTSIKITLEVRKLYYTTFLEVYIINIELKQ